jgi:endopolyphosphatase
MLIEYRYFFSSNSGVDGCANKHEPGYEHFEWLRIQLQLFRDRGMHAILIGHVPPARVDSKGSWDETCWQKYALWERQYRDVIVGSLYGHMNIDHFMLQDFRQIKKDTKNGAMAGVDSLESKQAEVSLLDDGEVTVASASEYLLDLRQVWAKLPSPPSKKKSHSISKYFHTTEEEIVSLWQKVLYGFSKSKKGGKEEKPKSDKQKYLDKIGGKYAERYSVNLVSPSVVPNYFPTLRIIEYNITGLEQHVVAPVHNQPKDLFSSHPLANSGPMSDEAYMHEVKSAIKRKQKKKEKDTVKRRRKSKFKVPKGPSKSSPAGPAYSPQPFTLIGYTQYFANLTNINNDFVAETINENSTHKIFGLDVSGEGDVDTSKWKEGKHHKHQGKKPRPEPHPKNFTFEVEYDTRTDKKYKLKDLTVRSFVELARKIGKDAAKSEDVHGEIEDVSEDGDDSDYDNGDGALEEDSGSEDEDDTQVETLREGKKHKKHKKKHFKNSPWFTFIQRAFVGTMDPDEIDEVFHVRPEEVGDAELELEVEGMEL